MTDLEIPESGAVFTFGKSRFAENKPSHFFIKNDPVVHVACGDEHTAVICQNGRIFAFGSNEWGQLGLGHNNMVHKPSCIKALKPEKAKFIACGRAHTIILTESNNIYACGSNTDGQLGLDNVDMVNIPTKLQHNQLKENGTIKKLSAGSQHSAALTESGLVFVWGSNSEGQLGFESNRTCSKIPTLLEFKDKIRDISCGYYHTAVITENGELFTFGENENGKLGLPQGDSQTYKPTLVNVPEPLESISCGGHHNIAITQTGQAVAFGCNSNGELGLSKDIPNVTEPQLLPNELFDGEKIRAVSCGDSHTAFITENYKIYTCGDTRHGKLCQDDNLEEGHSGLEQIIRFINYKVTSVSCGGCHTIICAQKILDNSNSLLPPLQRVPNSILNEIKTEVALETNVMTEKNINGTNDMGNQNGSLVDKEKAVTNGITYDINDLKTNGVTELVQTSEETLKNLQNTAEDAIKPLSNELGRISSNISEHIQSQQEQLNTDASNMTNMFKIESNATQTKIEDEINNITDTITKDVQDGIDDTKDIMKSEINNINDRMGLKSLKDNLASDSVDNLLQEIEDDLSNKSNKTLTSDTISIRSNGKNTEDIEEVTVESKTQNGDVDEEDLKTETHQPERKLSRIFGTFKRKKVSASSTLDSKIIDTEKSSRNNSAEIKQDNEIPVTKTDRTKTCILL